MDFSFTSTGDFKNTERALRSMAKGDIFRTLNSLGERGVAALAGATPAESGLTANSWRFEVTRDRGGYNISWLNSNQPGGFPVAIMLQYGHGTGTGGYVRGQDYINPAIRPIFDQIANEVWKAVKSA